MHLGRRYRVNNASTKHVNRLPRLHYFHQKRRNTVPTVLTWSTIRDCYKINTLRILGKLVNYCKINSSYLQNCFPRKFVVGTVGRQFKRIRFYSLSRRDSYLSDCRSYLWYLLKLLAFLRIYGDLNDTVLRNYFHRTYFITMEQCQIYPVYISFYFD